MPRPNNSQSLRVRPRWWRSSPGNPVCTRGHTATGTSQFLRAPSVPRGEQGQRDSAGLRVAVMPGKGHTAGARARHTVAPKRRLWRTPRHCRQHTCYSARLTLRGRGQRKETNSWETHTDRQEPKYSQHKEMIKCAAMSTAD